MEIEQDLNIVEIWLRKDPKRWMAGIVSGAIAGAAALAFACILSASMGREFSFPIKLLATPFLGMKATEAGAAGGTWVGFIFAELLFAFWGFVFAHFTGTSSLKPLLAMGLVWGVFTWIFNWNLFFQSWYAFRYAMPGSGAAFFVCLAFGLSLGFVLSVTSPIFQGKR